MKINLKVLLFGFAITISLCGCGLFTTRPENIEEPAHSTASSTPLDMEVKNNLTAGKAKTNNIWGAASSVSQYPATGQNGFYLPGSTIKYYDIESSAKVTCCAIAGCTHVGAICPANQYGLLSFLECGEYWCILTKVDGNHIQLSRIDPSTGERKDLYTWKAEEDEWLALNNCVYAYDCIYATITSSQEKSSSVMIDCYNVVTEQLINLTERSETSGYSFVGASENYAVVLCSELTKELLDYESYIQQYANATEDEYLNYVSSFYQAFSVVELRAIDIHTGAIQVIAGNQEQPYLFTDPNSCYDNLMVYGMGNRLVLCDMVTLSTTVLVEDDGLINAFLFDNKVFYITDDDGGYSFNCMDLASSEVAELESYETGGISFSISIETDDVFVGIYQGKHCWIYKNDFYAGRFDLAVKYE